VPGQVLGGVLALAVGEVLRRREDPGAARASALVMPVGVLDAHHHRVRVLARARQAVAVAGVPHDDRPEVAERELGTMAPRASAR
jgi:hypothetical protein